MRKKCFVVAGGEMEDDNFYFDILRGADFIIAADGGARHLLRLGIVPHLVMGDFDTLTPAELEILAEKGAEILRYPPEKDYTDTHLALLKAVELGYADITLLAVLGGRLDHTLANLMLLALPEMKDIETKDGAIKIYDSTQEIHLVRSRLDLRGQPGDTVTLLPLSDRVSGIETQGLKYPVPGGTFAMGIPIGVSNFMTASAASIAVRDGLLLVLHHNTPAS